MPLQNRVLPDGSIIASPARGSLMGNRGGQLHVGDTRQLHEKTRWKSAQWISCVLSFKGRQRQLMAPGRYTELFFLDQVTALAAGHRPCFECRRTDATAFRAAWMKAHRLREEPKFGEIDKVLHEERRGTQTYYRRTKREWPSLWGDLPVGAVITTESGFTAKHDSGALVWDATGYGRTNTPADDAAVTALTPPALQAVLHHGYRPQWHPSAGIV